MHNAYRSPTSANGSLRGNGSTRNATSAGVAHPPLSKSLLPYVFTFLCVTTTFLFVTILSHSSLSATEVSAGRGMPVNAVNKYSSFSNQLEQLGQLVQQEEQVAKEAALSVGKTISDWEHRLAQSSWLKDIRFSTLNYKGGFFGSVHQQNAVGTSIGSSSSSSSSEDHLKGIIAPTTVKVNAATVDTAVSPIPAAVSSMTSNSDSSSSGSTSTAAVLSVQAADKAMALSCPHAELVSYWSPASAADRAWVSPFANYGPKQKYVTFEPDVGGWNNIRMQMELVLVFAYVTGRTLVLPPDQPMYLLNKGKGHQNAHNFADFFPFEFIRTRLPVISMQQFLQTEAVTGQLRNLSSGAVAYPPLQENQLVFDATVKEQKLAMWDYLRAIAGCPKFRSMKEFLVIPPAPGFNSSLLPPRQRAQYERRCDVFGANRKAQYYDEYWQQQRVVHFISKPGDGYRLLEHFYTFLHLQDAAADRLMKRFVRDYVRYVDVIFCTGASIISKLLQLGNGSYSAFHIRRGELQYKEVKIPAEQILHNVGQFLPQQQLVYVATDERNKSFFSAFQQHFSAVRFLDDFMQSERLLELNPNMLGMIDQVVCTRGEFFVGTWFSTFTGYITRLRGYLGYSDQTVFFGDKAHRDRYHYPELPMFPFYMREWNISWDNID